MGICDNPIIDYIVMIDNLKKIKDESVKVTEEVTQKTLNFIITAFGLVAGLAWNEAIQSLINNLFIINKDSIFAKFVYAILMTSILALITIYLTKVLNKKKE